MLDSADKMWEVQQPGTILRARHSAKYGQLALVLARAYDGPKPSNGYPPRRYVKMQWISTGERFEEMLVNAHNCFDIVSSCDTLGPEEN
jgi:hypothetical protein